MGFSEEAFFSATNFFFFASVFILFVCFTSYCVVFSFKKRLLNDVINVLNNFKMKHSRNFPQQRTLCSKSDLVKNYILATRKLVSLIYSSFTSLNSFTWRDIKHVRISNSSRGKWTPLTAVPFLYFNSYQIWPLVTLGKQSVHQTLVTFSLCYIVLCVFFSLSAVKWYHLRRASEDVKQTWGISFCVDGMGHSCSLQWTALR